MARRMLYGALLLAACGAQSMSTAAPGPLQCTGQRVAVVANRSGVSVDIFDDRTVLGSVDPGNDGEFVLAAPTTRVKFRAAGGSTGAGGLRTEQVQIRYVCR